jgi:DNA sulfur modification protein DndC
MALNIPHLENEIIDQYLYDEHPTRPWIIGFSGGKDSTMLLQTVWNALRKVDPILLTRTVHVVCNDTLVENPRIVKFINSTLKKVQKAANLQQIPLVVEQTIPKMDDSFWVRLIGLGYPAPNKVHRWCTERLKIKPTTRLILEKVGENGEAIILLGTRSAESSKRSIQLKKHEVKGQRLRKHQLPNTYVYAPLKVNRLLILRHQMAGKALAQVPLFYLLQKDAAIHSAFLLKESSACVALQLSDYYGFWP